ncbi:MULTISPECIES: amidohydrolase family protein [unclassified Ekhidna]|jgi:hypothetical protein|uniref:amidohydrolase family protein n=1 Tax=unclassified Ekhidna TaxID=2632188 RepID=UPI0032DEE4E8
MIQPKRSISTSFLFIFSLMAFAQSYTGPIIDMHLHDYTQENHYAVPAKDGIMPPLNVADFRAEVMRYIDKYNIVKAMVSPAEGLMDLDKNNVFIPGHMVEQPPNDTVAFKELIISGEMKVFGEIGAIYGGYTLSDPAFEPYLDICERYDIPVAVHTGGGPQEITFRCCPNFRLKLGDPLEIEDVIVKHPKLRIYMMHAGEVFYENALRLMSMYPKLYADLGVLLWVDVMPMDYAERFLIKAKQYGLIDQVMFGSDQMVWPHAIEKSINTLNGYDFLTLADKQKIFYSNAERFLRLSEEVKKDQSGN